MKNNVIKSSSMLLVVVLWLTSCSEHLFWKKDDTQLYQTIRIAIEDEVIECEITGESIKPDPERLYFWMKNRKVHTSQGDYAGHLLNGNYERFYEKGTLKEKGDFQYGLKEGMWKSWNEEQKLVSVHTYSKGKKNGPFKVYEDGELIISGTYLNDDYNGKFMLYDDDAIEALVYKRGVVKDTIFHKTP